METQTQNQGQSFEWALTQMKAGKAVYRPSFRPKILYIKIGTMIGEKDIPWKEFVSEDKTPTHLGTNAFLADDWFLYEGEEIKPEKEFTLTIKVSGGNIFPQDREILTSKIERILGSKITGRNDQEHLIKIYRWQSLEKNQ